jgi:hypothetical protein
MIATVGTEVIVKTREKRSLFTHNNDLNHIIASVTLDTIVAFVIPFE